MGIEGQEGGVPEGLPFRTPALQAQPPSASHARLSMLPGVWGEGQGRSRAVSVRRVFPVLVAG